MLNKSAESGHSCLVPNLRGNAFSFSPPIMKLAVGLSHMAFIMLKYVPSMPTLWRIFCFFNHKWLLNFVRSFTVCIEMII